MLEIDVYNIIINILQLPMHNDYVGRHGYRTFESLSVCLFDRSITQEGGWLSPTKRASVAKKKKFLCKFKHCDSIVRHFGICGLCGI